MRKEKNVFEHLAVKGKNAWNFCSFFHEKVKDYYDLGPEGYEECFQRYESNLFTKMKSSNPLTCEEKDLWKFGKNGYYFKSDFSNFIFCNRLLLITRVETFKSKLAWSACNEWYVAANSESL